ncbi:MAG: hypothetical protein KC582_04585 [Candidatus Magasanikbacteria bacterium]|nr:hypothetical protein [Candidatus Magasanikbacteria bacterium]MCA9389002.1 hypothetical protein [Candidatus Magasanikbacteria bacterium]MCA9391504.1 hypothetical protein [Candidatus Magasanikbacteria bacterium]USN52787.1 MAG: hypothetical protein H6759_01815 [Candidatus Nomurabacteria bacterium]HPF94931.1 hypothetical protein [bacterium]
MSLNVPLPVLENLQQRLGILDAQGYISHPPTLSEIETFQDDNVSLDIVQRSLPGAMKFYDRHASSVKEGEIGYQRLCDHHFSPVEMGHLNRAAYGTAMNDVLARHHGGVRLYRTASHRWVLVDEARFTKSELRELLFGLSEQKPHNDDHRYSAAYQDEPETIERIRAEYPRAYAYLERLTRDLDSTRIYADIESKASDPALFKELVDALGIWPVRTLLHAHFDIEMVRLNCCGSVGKKGGGSKLSLAPYATAALQLFMQEPNSLDC